MGIDGAQIKTRSAKARGQVEHREGRQHPADSFAQNNNNRVSVIDIATWVALAIVTFILLYYAYFTITKKAPLMQPRPSPTKKTETLEGKALKRVKTNITWEISNPGNILKIDLKVTNSFIYRVKDINLFCSISGPSGTIIGATSKTLYDIIPANTEMHFGAVQMGSVNSQTAGVKCSISRLTVMP